MTYQPGDPDHLGVHNALASDVATLAARSGVDVTLPDEARLGDPGHVSDHNLLAAALAKIAAEGGPAWAVVEGGTVTTVDNGDGTTDAVHTFTADGTLTVTSPGYARVLCVSGGGGTFPNSGTGVVSQIIFGNGGSVLDLASVFLPAGAHAVRVGAGGPATWDSQAGRSSIGNLIVAREPGIGGIGAAGAGGVSSSTSGVASDITGVSVGYGACAGGPAPNRGEAYQNGQGTGAGSSGVVIVRVRQPSGGV